MWWNIAAAHRAEFEDWHTHEHFPERLGIPGFLRGSRWADASGGEGFFVMYELAQYATLMSEGYLARLNNPTPWSTKMMPHHRDMVRSQCRVLHTVGGGTGRFAFTLRLSPAAGREEELLNHLRGLADRFVKHPGGVAAHLLRTETPAMAATREQQIRGGADAAADWIWIATAYDRAALETLRGNDPGEAELVKNGSQSRFIGGLYELSCCATPADFGP